MAETNDHDSFFARVLPAFAVLCALACLMLSWFWVNAERRAAAAELRAERERQRVATRPAQPASGHILEAGGEIEKRRTDVTRLQDDVQKLRNELKALKAKTIHVNKRSWGPEQATGEPDVFEAGDSAAAWTSATEDGQPEWLALEYDETVRIVAVKVYETFNPGALTQVSVFDAEGKEIVAWTGKDPTALGSGMGVSVIPLNGRFSASKIKLYFDSPGVPGWNEIDAVGLVDPTGHTHWATGADASSTYADPTATPRSVEVPVLPNGLEF